MIQKRRRLRLGARVSRPQRFLVPDRRARCPRSQALISICRSCLKMERVIFPGNAAGGQKQSNPQTATRSYNAGRIVLSRQSDTRVAVLIFITKTAGQSLLISLAKERSLAL